MLSKQPVFQVQTRTLTAFLEEAKCPLLNLVDRSLNLGEYRRLLFPFKCRTLSIETVDIDLLLSTKFMGIRLHFSVAAAPPGHAFVLSRAFKRWPDKFTVRESLSKRCQK